MTIEHARKKLGKRADKLSDKEVTDITRVLERLVNKAIDEAVENDNIKST